MILQFENIKIREFHLADVNSIVNYANNYNISKYMRDSFPFPYTETNALNWIEFTKANNSTLSYAIANEVEVIGGISATPQSDVHRFSAEVGFWIGEPFWNQKIISKSLRVFCNYLFSKYNFNRLTANVFEGNDASKRVLEKAGFFLEGTLRKNVFKENKFVDHYIYGLLKKDFLHA